MQQALLRPKEAAQYLSVAESTLSKKRHTGLDPIPFVRIGRAVRYRQGDLDAYAADRVKLSTSQE